MHGVPNAIRARSTTGRVVWCIVCLSAACMFGLQLTQLLRRYFSYPRKVVIEVVPLAAPFPSISLCNMRNLDTVVLNRLNRIFLHTVSESSGDGAGDISEVNSAADHSNAGGDAGFDGDRRFARSSRRKRNAGGLLAENRSDDRRLEFDRKFAEHVTSMFRYDTRKVKRGGGGGFGTRAAFNGRWAAKRNHRRNDDDKGDNDDDKNWQRVLDARRAARRKKRTATQSEAESLSDKSDGSAPDDEADEEEDEPMSSTYLDEMLAVSSDNDDGDEMEGSGVDAEKKSNPIETFMREYLRTVSKYYPMHQAKNIELANVIQTVLSRTTIATNINRQTLTAAGVPFKEFIVTCR